MCDPKILQEAIEQYLEHEEQLFGGLNTGSKSWYKESVENNTSATNQSTVEPTIMSNKAETNTNTNSETKQEKTMDNGQQQQQTTPGAMEKTKGFFSNLWENHGKKIMFVTGIVMGAGAAVGYDTYANRESSTGGSEQV